MKKLNIVLSIMLIAVSGHQLHGAGRLIQRGIENIAEAAGRKIEHSQHISRLKKNLATQALTRVQMAHDTLNGMLEEYTTAKTEHRRLMGQFAVAQRQIPQLTAQIEALPVETNESTRNQLQTRLVTAQGIATTAEAEIATLTANITRMEESNIAIPENTHLYSFVDSRATNPRHATYWKLDNEVTHYFGDDCWRNGYNYYREDPVLWHQNVPALPTVTVQQLASIIRILKATLDDLEKKVGEADRDMATEFFEQQQERDAALQQAAVERSIEGEAAMDRLKAKMSFMRDPRLWLLATAVFGTGVGLYHGIPMLLAPKPQVVAEMSFRTPLQRLFGKKLPKTNIDKVIWAPETGEKIMRFTTRIQRVILRGGELMNMIFYGPPGTGKTMTAKAIARASGAEYMIINGAAFEQLPASKIISELEGVFRLAKTSKKPVIIFWDEADAALGKRGGSKETIESRRLINTFLSNVSDTHHAKIMFILATNLPHSLDDAVLSRFPQEGWIFFDRPEPAERAKILRMYLNDFLQANGLELSPELDGRLGAIAQRLNKSTGRDLRALARSAYDSLMDAEQTTLTAPLLEKVISDAQHNREQLGVYQYGQ